MRCQCCNRNLSDHEARLRHAETGEFLDICLRCLPDTGIPYVEPSNSVDDDAYDEQEYSPEEDDAQD